MQAGQQAAITGRPRDTSTARPAPYDAFDRMLIGGVWRGGQGGTVMSDHDPYSGDTLVEIPVADARDVDAAYRAADSARVAWANALPQERRDVLERATHLMESRKEEIVDWLIKESGSTHAKAMFEWEFAHNVVFEAATVPFHTEGRILPSSIEGKENRVYRQPIGVVGVISPWNFPLHLSMRSVAPALAVGDTVVLKPATETPVSGGLLIAKLFEEAGIPPGTLNVVVGTGKDIGDAIVDHPIPRVISFTGSTMVGRRIGECCGRQVKRVCLELSGNGPFIVFEDADLDRAACAAVAGKFMHQGQTCLAINRILVHEQIHDEFLGRFVERVAKLRVGDPSDPKTAIGPIINRRQLESILRKVDASIARGARVILRGQPSGLVLPPIVLAGVTNDMPIAHEEIFGPVAPFLRFSSEEEAISIANDTEYGLSSGVFTRDGERGVRIARRIEAGMTHVNDWPVNDEANTAFGGEKASGLGRFGGRWALEELTTAHWISLQELRRQYPI